MAFGTFCITVSFVCPIEWNKSCIVFLAVALRCNRGKMDRECGR